MGQSSRDGRRGRRTAREIYESLRGQIVGGVYRAGQVLPSTRQLASELGMSRNTVTAAYEQLVAEGYIEIAQGRKATVAATLLPDAPPKRRPKAHPASARLSALGQRLSKLSGPAASVEGLTCNFRYGEISAADFPTLAWRRSMSKALLGAGPLSLRYAPPQGSEKLQAALQSYLWRARTLRCDLDQIIVVTGSQQALDLSARILLDPGDTFAIEDPCYWAARAAFMSTGARAISIPVDEEGLCTDRLGDAKNARLCYVTPSHQFPMGYVLSVSRRTELLRWARANSAYIVEDDYDSEYRYDIRPIPPLHSYEGAANVIYAGTFSKTLSPLLRLGYMIVPPELIEPFRALKRLSDRHSSALEQEALADLLATGAYERHIRKVRRANGARRLVLLDALDREFGSGITIVGANAGLHVVVTFKDLSSGKEEALAQRCREAGVGIYPLAPAFGKAVPRDRSRLASFVFGYAALNEKQIRGGVARLRCCLKGL